MKRCRKEEVVYGCVEPEWGATVTPYRPATHLDPPEGGEVEDVQLLLDDAQRSRVLAALGKHHISQSDVGGDLEAFVEDFLVALDPRAKPDDAAFREAADAREKEMRDSEADDLYERLKEARRSR